MYSTRGSGMYGQQSYGGLSAYDQKETDSAYRGQAPTAVHYGGAYATVYSSASASSAQQNPAMSSKGSSMATEARGGYPSSSHVYGFKSDQMHAENVPEFHLFDRRQYAERQSVYMGREIPNNQVARFSDPVGLVRQHQPELYERVEQASVLHQESLLKPQLVPKINLDGSCRQIDFLSARGDANHQIIQDRVSYGQRLDSDIHGSSLLNTSSYSGNNTTSMLGAASRRNLDDVLHSQSLSNPGYVISLPPGREYVAGKSLHGLSIESDYHGSRSIIDEHRDDRVSYIRDFDLREEHRRELLREREKERQREDREREREHERERERERERVRERERERLRERNRERERKRERELILEHHEKKDRERRRTLEKRWERSPPKFTRDYRDSSLTEGKSAWRDSQSHEASHRRHSPVKEKRREYVCKVFSYSLVDTERDYLSIDKRYPRLFTSPEFCKVIVNWPKDNLKLSLQTPVSFEHDFDEVETEAELADLSSNVVTHQASKLENKTVWNAKIILMSGLSQSAFEALTLDKSYDGRVPHICNILRFAVLRKEHTFMAIGGPWDPSDGGDPSADDSALINTALRYAKDTSQLDLHDCHCWNRFLEIHYERFGNDGLFSHKEITVLFVPDLSNCLPSLSAWRDQWLAHKNSIAQMEHLSSRKEHWVVEKEGDKAMGRNFLHDSEKLENSERNKDIKIFSAGMEKEVCEVHEKLADHQDDTNSYMHEETCGTEICVPDINYESDTLLEAAAADKPDDLKIRKKKILKRIVKPKPNDKTVEINNSETSATKTSVIKKIIKKAPDGKSLLEDKSVVSGEIEIDDVEKPTCATEATGSVIVEGSDTKATVKKKIIKRVVKKKVAASDTTDEIVVTGCAEKEVVSCGNENKTRGKQTEAQIHEREVDKFEKDISKTELEKYDKVIHENSASGTKVEDEESQEKVAEMGQFQRKGILKDSKKSKDDDKGNNGKDDSKIKFMKEVKQKKLAVEAPRHPGLFLRSKSIKESKIRSMTLSLDSLLDYNDNDVEDSMFELSLFAESFYEMLQHQMGSRILSFLQKLRVLFRKKRNTCKRSREESGEMESSQKCLKSQETSGKSGLRNSEATPEEPQKNEGSNCKIMPEVRLGKPKNAPEATVEAKPEFEMDDEDDPEEDPEDTVNDDVDYSDEEKGMDDSGGAEGMIPSANMGGDAKKASEKKPELKGVAKTEKKCLPDSTDKEDEMMASRKKASCTMPVNMVDKDLLQAFTFFDRNRMGYIRVEDMRLILHALGKFLSYRDVKELVQSALLESNTGRNDRILYWNLVSLSGI